MAKILPRRPSVALVVETSNAYGRGLLRGVVRWLRHHRAWSVHLVESSRGEDPARWLARWRGDGVIARIENRRVADAVAATGAPAIDCSAARLAPRLPWVETDDEAISALAVDHLRARGARRFAFCGDARFNWSRWRGEAFARRVAAAGHPCDAFTPDAEPGSAAERAALRRWIARLPKPVAVMACYDPRGRLVIDCCRDLGLRVPEDVAVVGVDDDEVLCELCDPPLSSVRPDAASAGYLAASLLDGLMAGRRARAAAHRVPPLGVTARRSSDLIAVDDAAVAAALRLIDEHAGERLTVADLAARAGVTRRVLEVRFQRLVGRTPHAELLRRRLERAQRLLAETDATVAEIARRCAFPHAEYLSVAFKRELGLTPTAWRERQRG